VIAALKLVPILAWAVLALIVALAGAAIYQTLSLGSVRTEYADYRSGIDKAAKEAGEAARAEEARRQLAINQVRDDAQEQIKVATADAATAQLAADGLQLEINKLLANRAALNSKVAAGSATIRDLTTVLADLRQRADQRAGELAAIADSRRIAGLTCERAYDALAGKINSGP
jgi:peptidoglycan hydrolase CwlO-like protein